MMDRLSGASSGHVRPKTSSARDAVWTRTGTGVSAWAELVVTSPRTRAMWGFAAVDFIFIGDHAEVAMCGREDALGHALEVTLVLETIADEVGDRDHEEVVSLAEFDEVGNARHRAIFVHDLADDTSGYEAGDAGEVDGGFGLACADEDSTFPGAEGKDVAGTGEIQGG